MRFVAAAAGASLFLGLASIGTVARADEEKVALKDLPKAVLSAVNAKFPGCEIKEAEKEVEDGATTYEVSIKDDGRSIDVTLKPDGAILEVEKTIAVKDLPGVVAQTLAAEYPRAAVKKAEEIIAFKKEGEVKSYEVVVAEAGEKALEVKLSSNGKIVKRKEEAEDSD